MLGQSLVTGGFQHNARARVWKDGILGDKEVCLAGCLNRNPHARRHALQRFRDRERGGPMVLKDYGLNFFSQGLLVSCKGTGAAIHPEPGYRNRDNRDSRCGSNELALKIL